MAHRPHRRDVAACCRAMHPDAAPRDAALRARSRRTRNGPFGRLRRGERVVADARGPDAGLGRRSGTRAGSHAGVGCRGLGGWPGSDVVGCPGCGAFGGAGVAVAADGRGVARVGEVAVLPESAALSGATAVGAPLPAALAIALSRAWSRDWSAALPPSVPGAAAVALAAARSGPFSGPLAGPVRGRFGATERFTQPAGDGRLYCRRCGFDEFALFTQSGEHFLAGNTEFLGQLVYAGLTCHYISCL
ncbi:putative translation initiation factor IF-2 [Mycobacterium kansasii]|uniref:Putative translation initiation factor IF-2 n=1 Tax=Mycobacterium kansasii TaxID=1768 RepID=A0A1V3XTR2_MYCKA|nr:putative translation initiation factor IF-2 [Mycobacterium kansasii]